MSVSHGEVNVKVLYEIINKFNKESKRGDNCKVLYRSVNQE